MEFLAPAKVNLSLAIKGRLPNGFHEIETWMCPISLFDHLRLEVRASGGVQFSCSDSSLATEDNLVVRAANLFCAEVGLEPNLEVELRKEIPHGAGLGGGSSDAATTLLALNALFQTELPREALAVMAADLGSDVPFFIYQGAAICRGRGELVTPCGASLSLPLLLVKPPFDVPTAWAYAAWRESRPLPNVTYAPQRLDSFDLSNDLERPVFEKYLLLPELKQWLIDQAEVRAALMSGSGSTIFGVLREDAAAHALGERLVHEFGTNLWLYACRTITTGS